ncbi:hypothetical protein DPMN_062594 [Dreissena polymorpha]|uniref:Uncharacterized protein n=1 Tax=Dreissena polymorpha TaxID=45954 RepID=A0A9D4C906_DREPO|nr:hypothetical protein DPMN_062594 [Dreissena polymorpha]
MAERTIDLGSAYFEEMQPLPYQYLPAQPTQVQTQPISQLQQPLPNQYLSAQPTQVHTQPVRQPLLPYQYLSAQHTQEQTQPILQPQQPFPYQYPSVQPTGPYQQIQQPHPGQLMQFPPWQHGPSHVFPYPQRYPDQGQLQPFTYMLGHQGIGVPAGAVNHGFAPAGTNVQSNVQPAAYGGSVLENNAGRNQKQLLSEDEIKEGDLPLAESTPKRKAVPEDSNKFSSFYSSGYVTANQSVEGSPANVPVKQQIDTPVHSPNNQTGACDVTSRASGSRTSSISFATNKGSYRNNMSFSHMQYSLSSDLQSEMDEIEIDLNNVSKGDLMAVFKDVVHERDNLKTMIQWQDRECQRIWELKNQIAMEQQAKRDLVVRVNQEIEDKVEIIELKESKEQQAAMLTDKARVDQEFRELQTQFQKLQSSLESKLQQQIHQSREMIEQLETDRQIAIEEMEQQVHEEMERKDREILRSRSQAQSLGQESMQLKKRIEKLEKASKNQLEKARANQLAKARAIFKRLKAEKRSRRRLLRGSRD